MKIVGKVTKDYYDSALAFGVDETQVLIRNPEIIKEDVPKIYYKNKPQYRTDIAPVCSPVYLKRLDTQNVPFWDRTVKLLPHCIFFCGKIYFVYEEWPRGKLYQTIDEYITHRKREGVDLKEKEHIGKTMDVNYNKIIKDFTELAHEKKSPYFIAKIDEGGGELIIESWPVLSDYDFYKQVDPYTACQSIEQYYFGVLGGHSNPITEIEDEYKVQSKGFDKTYGFRKRPKKKEK